MRHESFTTVHSLPFREKEKIHEAVSDIIEKITRRRDQRNLRLEKSLARYIVSEWNPRADEAVRDGVRVASKANPKAKFTKKQLNKVLTVTASAFVGIEGDVEKRVLRDVQLVYANTKAMFTGQFQKKGEELYFTSLSKGKPMVKQVKSWNSSSAKTKAVSKATISGVNFSIVDVETTKQLGKLVNVAIGDHFESYRKPLISNSIEKYVLEEGMTNEQAAEFLQDDLTRYLGGDKVSAAVPESVAALGENSVNSYFENLVSTNMNWAQNFSRVNSMKEAGITRYQLAVVVDDSTSDICLSMEGRVFELKHAIDYMDTILQAEDVASVKEFAGWRDDLSEFNLSEGEKLDDASAADVLAANGMSMPPYHGHCRTEVEPA